MRGKIVFLTVFFIFTAIALFSVPRQASAVPAFARQTGLACNTCHFQHYPALNQFGRVFKAGGFTLIGGQSLVEGDFLSLPSVLNASLVTKIRYQKTNGDSDDSGTNKGEYQFPDEAALFLGGRIGEHIGFAFEAQMSDENAPMFASFKAPIVYAVKGVQLEVVPFTTDAFGPQFSFELLNSGAARNNRILEHRKETSAQQYVGTQHEAQGIGFVAHHPMGYVNYTVWAPEVGKHVDAGPYLHYVRAAVTRQLGDWDLGGGFQWWGGTTKFDASGTLTRNKAEAWAIDAQAQGKIASLPLGVYLAYATAKKSDPNEPANLFNSKTTGDKKAWTALAELGVLPGRATVAVGYRDGDSGDSANSEDNAITFGCTYLLAQNFEFQVNHSIRTGDFYDIRANNEDVNGDQLTTVMIFAAF